MVVTSAENDVAKQKIMKFVKEVDPGGLRTLAVITKPDLLSSGSDHEAGLVSYARNDTPGFEFKHGWHVIKNRNYETRHHSLAQRDKNEGKFFKGSIWEKALGLEFLGIDALRARLGELLENHTRKLLPSIISKIEAELKACELDLDKLGPSRETAQQQRTYLTEISRRFEKIVGQATEGNYQDNFFESDINQHLRYLRATVQNMNEMFALSMNSKGHSTEFRDAPVLHPKTPIFASSITRFYDSIVEAPDNNANSHLFNIKQWMREARGKELPSLFSSNLIQKVFRQQSAKWENIAKIHVESIYLAVSQSLSAVAHHVANEESARRLLREVISIELEVKRKLMFVKLQEVLVPYQKLHPITYDRTFNTIATAVEKQNTPFANVEIPAWKSASDIDEAANNYYKIALRTFIDNVAVLVVEMCLVDGLEKIFNPTVVTLMDAEQIAQLASEKSTMADRRIMVQEKKINLVKASQICRRHSDGIPQGLELFSPNLSESSSPLPSRLEPKRSKKKSASTGKDTGNAPSPPNIDFGKSPVPPGQIPSPVPVVTPANGGGLLGAA